MAGPSKDYDLVDGRYVAITPELEAMAAVIRRTFFDARASYLGKPNYSGKYEDFLKAAMLCKSLGEDPQEFTMRQVREMATYGVFYSNSLHSKKLSIQGQEKAEAIIVDDLARYRAQLLLFQDMLGLFTIEEILTNKMNPFSPLFRACIALRNNLVSIAGTYREAALEELAARPIARDIFKDEVGRL